MYFVQASVTRLSISQSPRKLVLYTCMPVFNVRAKLLIHKSGSSFLLVPAALAISAFQVFHTYTLVTQICSQHLLGL